MLKIRNETAKTVYSFLQNSTVKNLEDAEIILSYLELTKEIVLKYQTEYNKIWEAHRKMKDDKWYDKATEEEKLAIIEEVNSLYKEAIQEIENQEVEIDLGWNELKLVDTIKSFIKNDWIKWWDIIKEIINFIKNVKK